MLFSKVLVYLLLKSFTYIAFHVVALSPVKPNNLPLSFPLIILIIFGKNYLFLIDNVFLKNVVIMGDTIKHLFVA